MLQKNPYEKKNSDTDRQDIYTGFWGRNMNDF